MYVKSVIQSKKRRFFLLSRRCIQALNANGDLCACSVADVILTVITTFIGMEKYGS